MPDINIKGPIIFNDDQWIYDLFEIEATSPKIITDALEESKGQDVNVTINSGGGYVTAGSEIYTALMDYAGDVNVKIVGIAASAASVIAMAGTNVKISPTAQLMIHNVSGGAIGDYRDLKHESEVLETFNKSIANSYLLKTDLNEEILLDLMNKETWMNAQQAKKYGFVDEIMFDNANKLTATNGGLIPEEIINKLRNELKGKRNSIKLENDKEINGEDLKDKEEIKLAKAKLALEIECE